MTQQRTHTQPSDSPAGTAIDALERLVGGLRAAGWTASLVIPADRWPYVHVVNPYMRALNENVVAAPDPGGRWFFWWSWAEPVAETGDIALVLARISRVLALSGGR